MKIENLNSLKKVIQACRKLGVQSIKIDNIEFHLGDLPDKPIKAKAPSITNPEAINPVLAPGGVTEKTKIEVASEWDLLTDEQKMFYSSNPETPQISEQQ